MRSHLPAWLALVALAAAPARARAQEASPPAATAEPPGRALFLRACAGCHGEDGGGTGTVALERPARSFKEGGFSFGNTPEALQRTIGIGIPGTAMPGFGGALSDEDLRAVVAYVGALGPPAPPVDERDALLVVTDRPLIARGILPPIAHGLPLRPRGLLIGMPDGLTFEYRTDDVRLLGVREGGFVNRTDWTGRGGTPLQPLGQVVCLVHGGDPAPQLSALQVADSAALVGPMLPLACRFTGTWIEGPLAGLQYEVRLPAGRLVARVRESAQAVRSRAGAGFQRDFDFTFDRRYSAPTLMLAADDAPLDARVEHFTAPAAPDARIRVPAAGSTTLWVSRRTEGGWLCTGVRDTTPPGPAPGPFAEARQTAQGLMVQVEAPPHEKGNSVSFRVITVLASQWSDEQRDALLKELSP